MKTPLILSRTNGVFYALFNYSAICLYFSLTCMFADELPYDKSYKIELI